MRKHTRRHPSRLEAGIHGGPVEYFSKKAHICPRRFQYQSPTGMIKKVIQSCPEPVEGKAAAILTRGAYFQYVSTTKLRPACAKRFGEGRERRWWLFSTFPLKKDQDGFPITHVGNGHSLLSSPQEVGGDPSEGKGSLDYRQKQAGMTMMGMDSVSVAIFFEPL
jgi:hypothetical protein